MKVNLFNPVTKQAKQTKVGFSWTVFFFGGFPPLFRGDWKWFLIMLVAGACTFGVANLVFCFIYNKLYINDLLASGYRPADKASSQLLLSKGFTISSHSEEEAEELSY